MDNTGKMNIWVDTKGGVYIPCEELWWAIYISGAVNVDSLKLEESTEWFAQTSVGLDK